MALRPYDGFFLDLPPKGGKRLTQTGFAVDRSCTYSFSALGYRGEDYNPDAKRHIVVCGASVTFGLGLEYEDTWPCRFKHLYAKHEGIALADVNLLNLSGTGSSPSYVARTVVAQCSHISNPDLIIAEFPPMSRVEAIIGNRAFNIGPWVANAATNKNEAVEKLAQENPDLKSTLVNRAQRFYDYYTDSDGYLDLMQNILLMQYFCQSRNIPYLCSFGGRPEEISVIHKELYDLLDHNHAIEMQQDLLQKLHVDNSVIPHHPGAKSHKNYAQMWFDTYVSNCKNE